MSQSSYKRDIFSTFLNQGWRIISGPLVLLCIPYFLSAIEQGYWYTFISVAALSVFADLGFSNIILQFSAHEFAFLSFKDNKKIFGDNEHLDKLATFFNFSLKWMIKIVIIVFPLIIIIGYYFINAKGFSGESPHLWPIAWLIYSVASAFIFMNSIVLSFFEGCNLVSKVQKIRFQISAVTSIVMIIGLVLHLKLFALALSSIAGAIIGCLLIYYHFFKIIVQLVHLSKHTFYDWWPEFSSLIWRYAISWGSGFLVFQIFTPLTFYFFGPISAGKIGISISMWTAGFNISISWITAVTPKLNMLISEKKWTQLDYLFNNSLIKSVGTMILGGLCFFLIEYFVGLKFSFFNRIMAPTGMLILFLAWLLQVVINTLAIYLRAHKREPLVPISCVNAIIVLCGTALCGMYLESEYLFLGFLVGSIFECIATFKIFKNYQWQHSVYDEVM